MSYGSDDRYYKRKDIESKARDERLKKAESDMGRRKAILARVKSGEITLIEAQGLISKSSASEHANKEGRV